MPQASDPLYSKQVHAWDNFDRNGNLVQAESKDSRIVVGRDVFNTQPANYAPLPYPHPWRAGYEVAA